MGSLLVVLLASCNGGHAESGDQPDSGSTAPASPTASSPPTEELPPAPTTTPEASSGPLSPDALPAPQELGPGWQTRVEGVDPEEGVGNGTPYQERDPAEITQMVLPLGCAERSASPEPRNVLQATYAHRKPPAYAVALRLRFESPAAAREFADVLREDLATCATQPDDPFSGAPAPVLSVSGTGQQQVVRYRLVGEQARWIRALQVVDSDVLTLDSDAEPRLVDWAGLGYQSP